MKIWNKVKFPLLIVLLVAVFAFIRYITMAVPSWVNASLIYPLLVMRLLLEDTWTSVILLGIGAAIIMCVPCGGAWEKLRRFLLRPALAVLVILGLSNFAIAANDSWEDQLYQRRMYATYAQIHAFVDVADEAFAYNTHSQHFDNRFRKEFPQLLLETMHSDGIHYYYSDYILIDYDTHRVGVVYNQYGILRFFVYQLEPVDSYPVLPQQNTIALSAPGATLKSFCRERELSQYTDGFALIKEDGSIYAITGLCDKKNLYLGLNSTVEPIGDFSGR